MWFDETMNITARSDYALRAMVELAKPNAAVISRTDLADRQGIPHAFLEAILRDLRRSGLVLAQRGSRGGYTLGRPGSDISLADVIRAVSGPLTSINGLPPESTTYDGSATALRDVWVAMRASLRGILETVTIADVAENALPPEVTALLTIDDVWRRRE